MTAGDEEQLPLSESDELFAERVGQRLDAEAESLNAPTLSRLNQARQAALAEMPQQPAGWFSGFNWAAPVSAAVLAGLIGAILWVTEPGLGDTELSEFEQAVAQSREAETDLSPDEFELVMSVDDIGIDMEMLAELEFYTWLEAEMAAGDASS